MRGHVASHRRNAGKILMPKVPVSLGEWRPDLSLLDNQFAIDVENVLAGANSYRPVPSLQRYSAIAPIPDPVVGLVSFRTTTGAWGIIAGTATKLYKFSNTGWIDVSRTVGGLYNVPVGELWSFAVFGDHMVAVQIGDVPQVLDLIVGTHFDALAGSPPQAHKVTQIGDFLVLSNLQSNQRKIRWSGINDITQWTIGMNLCDEQEFPDGGPVQGVAGSETIGYVVQDRCIRTMQWLPNDTNLIFSFSRVMQDRGSISEFGYCTVANILYFAAEEGFYALAGQQLNPIGNEKVNEWWLENSDLGRRNVMQAFAANRPWVFWAMHASSSSRSYDRVLLYNWALDRWVRVTENAQMWAVLSSTELDLDTDDPTDPDDVYLDSASRPLDSFAYLGGRPLIAAIDLDGNLATLDGPNLQATMETVESHLVPGQRTFVSEVYPLVDTTECLISVGTRERLGDVVTWSPPVSIEITGSAAVYTSARLHRFRLIVPYASHWTHASGAFADAQQDGSVA
jgi:hypothetical protein